MRESLIVYEIQYRGTYPGQRETWKHKEPILFYDREVAQMHAEQEFGASEHYDFKIVEREVIE